MPLARLIIFLFAASPFACAEDFLIQHVRLFDGERTISSTSVLVRNGRIDAVGPRLRPPKGTRVVDGSGHTLLPGLIDAHTHIRSRQDLEQSLVFGVTTDLSMLMDLELAAEEKVDPNFRVARYQTGSIEPTAWHAFFVHFIQNLLHFDPNLDGERID